MCESGLSRRMYERRQATGYRLRPEWKKPIHPFGVVRSAVANSLVVHRARTTPKNERLPF